MSIENDWVIVCGILVLVVLFNVGLAFPFLRSRGKLFKGSWRGFRLGWQEEEEKIAELRKRVEELTESPINEGNSSED